MSPFFSIIIPVYNVSPYLRECLDSVLAQTFTDWEAICVDDGSTDGSGAILDEYAAQDSRFRVYHQLNAGVSTARNKALDVLNGRYVLFLDADDLYVDAKALESIKEVVGNGESDDLLFYKYARFKNNIPCSSGSGEITRIDISKHVPSVVFNLLFGSGVYPSELLRGLRFPAQRLGEDMIFLTHALCRVKTVCLLDLRLYGYRNREGSAMNGTKNLSHFFDLTKMVDTWLLCYKSYGRFFSADAFDSMADWLFNWIPHDLLSFNRQDRAIAEDELWRTYRNFIRLDGNKSRYIFAVVTGGMIHSYKLTCLLSGRMELPHFGIKRALSRFFH